MTDIFPLTVRDATTRRFGKILVGPVSLDLDGQGTCVIVGPNGSGKTTLLRLLHGTARLHSGEISWACDTKHARNVQAFVFQRPVMLRRSVGENLAYPLRMRGSKRKNALTTARDWAGKVGPQEFFEMPAHVLSGGEQQKLAIARALIVSPKLLFLDEPCAALDGRSTREIEDILADARRNGTRLILSTHDMGQARRMADQVVFLLAGKVHETGHGKAFFAQPKTSAAAAFLKGDIVE